jgi:hypothetical protein
MEEMTITENNKVTNEELDIIRKHQQELNSILNEVGYIEATKHGLLHRLGGINEDVEKYKKQLEKNYGPININLETGSYEVIDKKEKSNE